MYPRTSIPSSRQSATPDNATFRECTITKVIDQSQYTVVFDDGDETTLRRTSLCLKSGNASILRGGTDGQDTASEAPRESAPGEEDQPAPPAGDLEPSPEAAEPTGTAEDQPQEPAPAAPPVAQEHRP